MSKIEWTDETWNCVRGCSMAQGSETGGCLNCYAARLAARNLPSHRSPTTGEPYAVMRQGGPRWTGRVELIPSKLDEPLRWWKPRRVFVNSMSDLFHEALPDEAIDQVFAVMVLAGQHTYQTLTKRGARMLAYFQAADVWARIEVAARRLHYEGCAGCQRADLAGKRRPHFNGVTLKDGPYSHIWLGVSVEDQTTADERIPLLLQTPAAVRFVSYEPALGPVDFEAFFPDLHPWRHEDPDRRIDQVIVGGESGPGARPCDVEWIRSVVRQCREAGVACFVKQLGSNAYDFVDEDPPDCGCREAMCEHVGFPRSERVRFEHPKGGEPAEWPEDLRVREFPKER